MIKVDFHVHSNASVDSSITDEQIEKTLGDGILDKIAITDHNETSRAIKLYEQLGDKIIIGEEITSEAGHIIGLFLKKKVPRGLSLKNTVDNIKEQGGIVYLPHIYDRWRKGIGEKTAGSIIAKVDVIESFNSRASKRNNEKSEAFTNDIGKLSATSTDSHTVENLGIAYTIIEDFSDRQGLLDSLGGKIETVRGYAPFTPLPPLLYKIKKKLFNNG